MKIKKLLILLLLFTVMFGLGACSEIKVMNISNNDGTIDEMVYVSLDVEKLLEKDKDIEEIKLDIRNNSLQKANEFKYALNNRIDLDVMIIEDQESKDLLLSYKDGISIIINEWQNNRFSIGIRFKNENVYKYFYNITDDVIVEPKIDKSFFYNKLTYYGNTMYIKHFALYESVRDYYSLKYPEFVDEDVSLKYTYVTDLKRQHSNADEVEFRNGQYYHTWNVDPDNIDDKVELYYNIANKSNCILVCIGITFAITIIITGISAIIYFIKNKNNKK
ncbi:MAG: hypothetical protein IKC49_00765 [Clostridia bacterium]|nr:hypothetical protein [Clostridia bacterium]